MAVQRLDPTRTTGTRRRYTAELNKAWRKLKGDVNEAVVTNDGFGLTGRPVKLLGVLNVTQNGLVKNRQFDFPTNAQKRKAFLEWMKRRADVDVLRVHDFGGRDADIDLDRWWGSAFIRAGYSRGVSMATQFLIDQGIAPAQPAPFLLTMPIHAETLQLLFTRNYEGLKNITLEMDTQLSRVLTDGFVNGYSPRKIAKAINETVNNVSIRRSRMLARTEVIHAHAQATLNQYQRFGVKRVGALVEFSTSNNGVCPICQKLEGKTYTIDQARGVIPVHPNCRCTWLPVIDV